MGASISIVSLRTYIQNRSCMACVFAVVLDLCSTKLSRHLVPRALACYIYHGHNKKSIDFLRQFDVVITTYHTIAAIWKHHSAHQDDESLYSLTWHRIVLDEGEGRHIINLHTFI